MTIRSRILGKQRELLRPIALPVAMTPADVVVRDEAWSELIALQWDAQRKHIHLSVFGRQLQPSYYRTIPRVCLSSAAICSFASVCACVVNVYSFRTDSTHMLKQHRLPNELSQFGVPSHCGFVRVRLCTLACPMNMSGVFNHIRGHFGLFCSSRLVARFVLLIWLE